jgi:hypothetical protein
MEVNFGPSHPQPVQAREELTRAKASKKVSEASKMTKDEAQ